MSAFQIPIVYARIYGTAAAQALGAIRKSPWTLALPAGLIFVLAFAGSFASAMPAMLGGILFQFAKAAAVSAYLYFAGQLISASKTSIEEFRHSVAAYFWPVVSLSFFVWVVEFLAASFIGGREELTPLYSALLLAEFLVLNATPETIYLKGTTGGLETITESIKFLNANWLEWYIPNAVLAAVLWGLYMKLPLSSSLLAQILAAVVLGIFLHLAMLFRGFLFRALDGSTHRQRMFRNRV